MLKINVPDALEKRTKPVLMTEIASFFVLRSRDSSPAGCGDGATSGCGSRTTTGTVTGVEPGSVGRSLDVIDDTRCYSVLFYKDLLLLKNENVAALVDLFKTDLLDHLDQIGDLECRAVNRYAV